MKDLRNLNELLREIKTILKKVSQSDRICIVHHDDADGNCSAALFSILFHNLIEEYPILFPVGGTDNINKKLINQLKAFNPDYVLVLDVTADPKNLNIFKGFVLDHHIYENITQREGMPYFNPRSFEKHDEKVVPTSYMTYRVLNDFFPDEKVAWIAGIGITEDHRVDLCKKVFERIKIEKSELLKIDIINQKTIEESFYGEFRTIVISGRMIKGKEGAKTAVLALIECKDRPDKFINGLTQHSSVLRKFYDKVKYETQYCLEDVKREGEFFSKKKIIFYEQERTRMGGLTSFISDKIREKYPEWIACVINREYDKKRSKISIRLEQTERKEDLISILEKIKETIPSMKGGGHRSAIGILLNLDDIDDFKKEFLRIIK